MPNALIDILLLVAGLVLLYFGSEYLVRGAARLARRLGLSPFVIGVTVVAFGTSAPEMFAAVKASMDNNGGLALGAVLGSNFANICLILGVTALVRPVMVGKTALSRDLPVMMGITLLAAWTMFGGEISRPEGALLFAGLLAYIVFNYCVGRRDPQAVEHEIEREHEHGLELEADDVPRTPVWTDLLFTVGGLVGLALGADLLVRGAVGLAEAAGVPPLLIGLSVVAFGTSLPELAAGVQAVLRKQSDIAVGNIVGSNVFNLLGVLGAAAMVRALPVGRETLFRDVAAVVLITLILWPLAASGRRITRFEGGVLVVAYLGYIAYAYLA